jgi:hypothetical protein
MAFGTVMMDRRPMLSRLLHSLRDLLYRPLFGTKVIPSDARVDPALFSEEEFPVYCEKCDYLLRGLPDGRCPECGQPFERGRLLALQYGDGQNQTLWTKPHRWAHRLSVAAFYVCMTSGFLFVPAALGVRTLSLPDPIVLLGEVIGAALFLSLWLVCATYFVWSVCAWRESCRNGLKRRRVREAFLRETDR